MLSKEVAKLMHSVNKSLSKELIGRVRRIGIVIVAFLNLFELDVGDSDSGEVGLRHNNVESLLRRDT